MVSHSVDTANDKYTDGYKDNAFDVTETPWDQQSDGSYKRTVKRVCKYCGYEEDVVETKRDEVDDITAVLLPALQANTDDHGDQDAEHDGVDAHTQSNGIQDGHEQGQRCDGLHEHGDDEEDQQDHNENDSGVGGEAQHGLGHPLVKACGSQHNSVQLCCADDDEDTAAGADGLCKGKLDVFPLEFAVDDAAGKQTVNNSDHACLGGADDTHGNGAHDDDRHEQGGPALPQAVQHRADGEVTGLLGHAFFLSEEVADDHLCQTAQDTGDDAAEEQLTGGNAADPAFTRSPKSEAKRS